jgi:hypothetical protein
MEEAYRAHVRQVMDAAGWHWPEHLLMDPARGPRFLSSAAELLHELQLGTHMDEVLVLPDGVEKLGGSAMDPRVQQVRVRLLLSLSASLRVVLPTNLRTRLSRSERRAQEVSGRWQ